MERVGDLSGRGTAQRREDEQVPTQAFSHKWSRTHEDFVANAGEKDSLIDGKVE
jgi:hypothetical protein